MQTVVTRYLVAVPNFRFAMEAGVLAKDGDDGQRFPMEEQVFGWRGLGRGKSKYFALIILILFMSFPILRSEFHLYLFSNQIDKIFQSTEVKYRLLSSGSNIFVLGNGEGCTFEATRLFRIYESSEDLSLIKSKIENMTFSPAKITNDYHDVDIFVQNVESILIVSLQSGPFSAGLDFRCW